MRLRLSNLRSTLHAPLLIAGAIGFVIYFLLLPRVHPDAGARTELAPEEARAMADARLRALGVDVAPLDVRVSRRRHQKLLRHLQEKQGLRAAVAGLRADAYGPLPVYYNRVVYLRTAESVSDLQRVAEVHLLDDGRLVGLRTPGVEERTQDPDALLGAGIDWGDSQDSSPSGGEEHDYARLARYHLGLSAWADGDFRVDSIRVMRGEAGSSARVMFQAETPIAGTMPTVQVEVGSDGDLREIVLEQFDAGEEVVSAGGGTIQFGASPDEGAGGIMKVLVHTVLFILLLVLFFRRLDARLVDSRGALRDALLAGLLGTISTGMVVGFSIILESGGGGFSALLALVVSVLSGALTFVIVYVASAVGDSYAREAWPDAVRPLDLVRQLSWINQSVGSSIIHGTALAGLLVAAGVLVLHLPGAGISMPAEFPSGNAWRPVVSELTTSAWLSLYLVFAVAAAVGGWLRGRFPRLAVFVPVLIFGLADVAVVPISPLWLAIPAGIVSGGIIMWSFMRYGIVAAAAGIALAQVAMNLAPGWLAAPAPETVDFVAMLLVVAALLVVGFVGATSSRRVEGRTVYVPGYVREHSEQQRIERELEIARSVQMSFLPRVMPRVEGLDAHGVCIPAHEVGGDYYDVVVIDDRRVAVVIGDVSGKGIQAAFYMTLVKGIILTLAGEGASPRAVLSRVNHVFCESAPRGTFISLIYGVLDIGSGTFRFARAGHNPLVIVRAGKPEFRRPAGMAIGLLDGGRFAESLEEEEIHLDPGDYLVLYTDGVSEAMDARREQFGEARLARVLDDGRSRSAAELLKKLQRAVDDFAVSEGRLDDMTMIVLRRSPPPAGAMDDPTEDLVTNSDELYE